MPEPQWSGRNPTTNGGSGPELVTATITSAELNALTFAAPITLEPARPGYILVPYQITTTLSGTTAYEDGQPMIGIQYGPPLYPLGGPSTQSLAIPRDPNTFQSQQPIESLGDLPADIANRPLALFLADSGPPTLTGGDGDLTIAIAFIPLPDAP